MPILIRAAAVLGPAELPESVVAHWISSLAARYELNYGPDDFVLETTPLWDLQKSEMSLIVGDESFRQSTIALTPGQSEVRFARICEVGHPLYATANAPAAALIVKYPESPLVRLRLEPQPESSGATSTLSSFPVVDFLTSASFKTAASKVGPGFGADRRDGISAFGPRSRSRCPRRRTTATSRPLRPRRPIPNPSVKPATTPAQFRPVPRPAQPPTESAPASESPFPIFPCPGSVPPKLPR